MKPWKTLERRLVLDRGRFLRVEEHTVELPDGRRIGDWPWLITPDFANAVAVTADGLFVCFRQTKYAVEGITLALPGGFIEPGEDPLAAAQRELREETGYTADSWEPLGTFVVDSNRGAGRGHFYLARDARPGPRAVSDDLEEQEMILLTRAEMEEAVTRGDFKALAWTCIAALALRRC